MTITVKKVSTKNRMNFLVTHFGRYFLQAENYIYDNLDTISSNYKGGLWEFYELSNKGFYMAPASDQEFTINVLGNGYHGTVSADAAGIITSLFALNALSWKTDKNYFSEAYYSLREFACEHREAKSILSAID